MVLADTFGIPRSSRLGKAGSARLMTDLARTGYPLARRCGQVDIPASGSELAGESPVPPGRESCEGYNGCTAARSAGGGGGRGAGGMRGAAQRGIIPSQAGAEYAPAVAARPGPRPGPAPTPHPPPTPPGPPPCRHRRSPPPTPPAPHPPHRPPRAACLCRPGRPGQPGTPDRLLPPRTGCPPATGPRRCERSRGPRPAAGPGTPAAAGQPGPRRARAAGGGGPRAGGAPGAEPAQPEVYSAGAEHLKPGGLAGWQAWEPPKPLAS